MLQMCYKCYDAFDAKAHKSDKTEYIKHGGVTINCEYSSCCVYFSDVYLCTLVTSCFCVSSPKYRDMMELW